MSSESNTLVDWQRSVERIYNVSALCVRGKRCYRLNTALHYIGRMLVALLLLCSLPPSGQGGELQCVKMINGLQMLPALF